MFTLRPATSQDITAVDALLARAYPRLLGQNYTAATLKAALPLISRAQSALVTCGTSYLVEDDGRLLGAGGWTPDAQAQASTHWALALSAMWSRTIAQ